MRKIKQPDFSGQTIFCGIDVHKKGWRVNVRSDEFELGGLQPGSERGAAIEAFAEKIPGGELSSSL